MLLLVFVTVYMNFLHRMGLGRNGDTRSRGHCLFVFVQTGHTLSASPFLVCFAVYMNFLHRVWYRDPAVKGTRALDMTTTMLRMMGQGGIHDHVGQVRAHAQCRHVISHVMQ